MKAILYKDRNPLMLWTSGLCIVLIIMVCIAPSLIFRFLFSYFIWTLCVVPSTFAMTDLQEKADKMYGIMPIKPTVPVLLRYLYLCGLALASTILFQTIVCVSNYRKCYPLFNINNMVTQSMLTLTFVFASLWLMSSLIVKNRFINALIIMLSGVTFGIIIFFLHIELDCTKIDYIGSVEVQYININRRLELLLRGDLHIIFWCVCLLIVFMCYHIACAVVKKRQ